MLTADHTISATDMKAFIATEADFAFEMRVLHEMERLDYQCEHAGTFRDPVTDKIRQFDIRARSIRSPKNLWLSIECKNLRSESPLLVHAVPRPEPGSFHQVIGRWAPQRGATPKIITVERLESAYRPGEPVGKKTDQVTRKQRGFVHSDSAVFDKVSQSINSARDLVAETGTLVVTGDTLLAVVPILVVPDGRLWQVDYARDGAIATPPRLVSAASLYLNHRWLITNYNLQYTLSHLEIVQLSGLEPLLDYLMGDHGLFALQDALWTR